jgi:hypothetical protein
MVDLFDGTGVPIDTTVNGRNGVALDSESTFVDEHSNSNQFDLVEEDAEVADLEQIDELDDFNGFDRDATPIAHDPSAETWTDDDVPTEHQFATGETIALENELEEADDFVDEDDEPDSSSEIQSLHDFRIEERGPISEENYEVVSDEPIAVNPPQISHGVAPMHVRSNSRSKQKRSSLRTLLGIAMGPLLALPIAGLIFYLLGTDLGFWPLDGGRSDDPNVRASTPMDLDHFNPKTSMAANASGQSGLADTKGSDLLLAETSLTSAEPASVSDSLRADQDGDKLASNDKVTLDRSFWAPPELADDQGAGEKSPQETSGEETMWASPKDVSTPDDQPSKPLPLPAKTNVKPVEPVNPKAKESAKPLPKNKKPTASAPEPDVIVAKPAVDTALAEAVDTAKNYLVSLSALSKTSPEYGKTLAWTYAAIAEFGDQQQGESSQAAIELLSQLKKSKHLDDFGVATPQWLVTKKRKTDGVILVGRPGSNESGPTITLTSGTEVPIITNSVEMPNGDKVVALGRIESQSPNVVVRITAIESAN